MQGKEDGILRVRRGKEVIPRGSGGHSCRG